TFSLLGVVVVGCTIHFYHMYIVMEAMKLWKVEIRVDPKIKEDVLIVVKAC
ncbi:hypothetical protein CY34DRAFT_97524, partial [Suillus luteus UH-Slu-Lm8-n1]